MIPGILVGLLAFIGSFRENRFIARMGIGIPIDMRIVLLVILLIFVIYALFSKGVQWIAPTRTAVICYLGILSVAYLGYPETPTPIYGGGKLFTLSTVTLFCILSANIFMGDPDRKQAKRFFLGFFLGSGLIALGMLGDQIKHLGQDVKATQEGFSYITRGRIYSVVIIIGMVRLASAGRFLAATMGFLLVGAFSFFLFKGVARGPVIALALSLFMALSIVVSSFVFSWFPGMSHLKRKRASLIRVGMLLVLLVGGGTAVVLADPAKFNALYYRFSVLLKQKQGGASAAGRLSFMTRAIQSIPQAPAIGHGIGGFAYVFAQQDFPDDAHVYPHNLLVEVACELGLVGLGLLLILLVSNLYNTLLRLNGRGEFESRERYALELCVFALFVCTLINAQLSGDMNDNRFLFMLVSLQDILNRGSPRVSVIKLV